MRTIDADTLIIKVQELIKEYERRMPEYSANDMLTSGKDAAMKWGYKADGVEDALKLIIDAPIIKAETIKHGRWIRGENKGFPEKPSMIWYCSVCGERIRYNDTLRKYQTIKKPISQINSRCRNCGARMDGGEEDKEQQDKEGGV